MIGGGILVFPIGCFLYGIAMTKCIKGSLFAINQNVHTKHIRSLEQLAEFTEFHSRAKQLSVDTTGKEFSFQMSISFAIH